jgi:RHS repeat-associated protein
MTNSKGTQTEIDDVHLVYFYDANGNIGQLVNADLTTATILARYEYYPFGGILSTWSDYGYGNANPFRFSTKYRDSETGLYYWDHRYLIPRLGRWLSRDPIGERGAMNLYMAMRNNAVNRIDPDGRACAAGLGCSGPWPPPSGPTPPPPPVVPPPPPPPPPTTPPPTTRPGCTPTTQPQNPTVIDCDKLTTAQIVSLACPLSLKINPTTGHPSGGGVTCLCGIAVICNWNRTSGDSDFDRVTDDCNAAHEGVHVPGTDCSQAPQKNVPWRPPYAGTNAQFNSEECSAHEAQLSCYFGHLNAPDCNPWTCRLAVVFNIHREEEWLKKHSCPGWTP